MKPRRCVLHWTGGSGVANAVDRRSYHYLVQASGSVVMGVPLAHNLRDIPPGTPTTEYAAHVRGRNSWSAGVALCGMLGAKQGGPYGSHPITEAQALAMCKLVARLTEAWELPVRPHTVFHHAEAQSDKWDIAEFPWDRSITDTGTWLRNRIRLYRAGEPVLREVRDMPRVQG